MVCNGKNLPLIIHFIKTLMSIMSIILSMMHYILETVSDKPIMRFISDLLLLWFHR